MRFAVLTDTHFGARNSSPLFLRHLRRFFTEVFWPTVDRESVQGIIHVGDVFDQRRTISVEALAAFNECFRGPAATRKLPTYLVVGNHDQTYRERAEPNVVAEVLTSDPAFTVVSRPTTILHNRILLLPWITPDIARVTDEIIKTTEAKYVFGHLDITGARMGPNRVSDGGLSPKLFRRFAHVYSGHFHCRSTPTSNITYLSNPVDLTWDEQGWHGFWLFEAKTGVMEPVETPWRVHNIVTESTGLPPLDGALVRIEYTGKLPERLVETVRMAGAADVRALDLAAPSEVSLDAEAGPTVLPSTQQLIHDYVADLADDKRVSKKALVALLDRLYDIAITEQAA